MEEFPGENGEDASNQSSFQRIGTTGGKISRNPNIGVEPSTPVSGGPGHYDAAIAGSYTPEQIAEGDVDMVDREIMRDQEGWLPLDFM